MIDLGQPRGPSCRIPRLPALPKDFIFGASTAAYQIEGAWNQDGKGLSFWDIFSHVSGNMTGGDNGDVACDHYNRVAEDVSLMKQMSLDAYRFSISWSRVMPNGRGAVNPKGLDFYDRLVDALLEAGIDPYPTLYHWDLPQGIHELGGWLNRDSAHYFADYAAVVARRLADRVKHFSTFNELEVIVAGYTGRGLAPGFDSPRLATPAGHNLLRAHGHGLQALRANAPGAACGIVLNFVPIDPADRKKATALAAQRRWRTSYGWFLDGILKRVYPPEIMEATAQGLLSIHPEDMTVIGQKIDFLGINYYTRFVVDTRGDIIPVPGADTTLMGWEIRPRSLTDMLVDMKAEYPNLPPVYITENGAALTDELKDGRVQDAKRIAYLDQHLRALNLAVKRGVDVRGYFVWSLMDNLEWSLGYAKTFGLIHVDRTTLARTIKDSGHWYRRLIEQHHR